MKNVVSGRQGVISSASLFLLLTIFFVSTPSALHSQGSIHGTVTDSLDNSALIGANVFLVGTSLGSATDRDGKYRIVGIPAGSYTLRISYLGYRAKDAAVNVGSVELIVDGQLAPDIIEAGEVLVTAQARGQIAAINQQVTANTIVSVVSEEKIQELPDANAAEAIGRLPGVSIIRSGGEASKVVLRGLSSKFSNITVDGVKIPPTDPTTRDVDLSTLSQGSLAGVELYKALRADMDADAIAGAVNLVTRKAPSDRLLRFDIKGDYNHLMRSANQYDFSLRYGERFFEGLLGVQLQGNLEQKIRSRENSNINYTYFDPDSTTKNFKNYFINNFFLTFTDETRDRQGAGIILDVNTPDSGSIKLNTLYGSTGRDYMVYTRNYPVNVASINYSVQNVEQDISTFNSSLQVKNNLLGFNINWGLSYAQSRINNPYDFFVNFLEDSKSDAGMKPGAPLLQDHPEQLIPFAWNNYSAATCSTGVFQTQNNFDKERTATLDLSGAYSVPALFSGEFKLGGKLKDRRRWMHGTQSQASYWVGYFRRYNIDGSEKALLGTTFDRFYREFLATNGSTRQPLAADFISGSVESRDLFDIYNIAPLLDRDALRLWYELNKNGKEGNALEYYDNPLVTLNNYDITERISAGYIMNTLNVGQEITLITGLRLEREQNDYYSKWSPDEATGFPVTARVQDTSTTFSETTWFPSAMLVVRPTEYLQVRATAYRALARPDFNLRLEQFAAQRSGSSNAMQVGNSQLRNAKAWNYELNAQAYSSTIGLVSVSFFYKEIKDLFHQLSGASVYSDSLKNALGVAWPRPQTFGFPYQLTVPYNSNKSAKAWGIEFEHQIQLRFLPGYLQNLLLSYNFSITRSETFLISTSVVQGIRYDTVRGRPIAVPYYYNVVEDVKRRSEGQPELYGNVALGYEEGGFSARVSVFYQGEYNNTFSSTGQTDVIQASLVKWDLALRHQLTDYLAVFLNLNNFTNAEDNTLQVNRGTGWRLDNTRQLYGITGDVGVRISL